MTRNIVLLLSLVACFSCSEKSNDTLRKIADLQDRRQTDSLLVFLSSDDAAVRKRAAIAFASVQDTTAIEALSKLNDDEAAFALGQMYNAKAVSALLPHKDYESLGKCVTRNDLAVITNSDDEATAWGLYRAAVRGVVDSASATKALEILGDQSGGKLGRLGAAQLFSRTQYPQSERITNRLIALAGDRDVDIRMAIVNALGKAKQIKGLDDADYRVRVNAVRGLTRQRWDVAKPLFETALNDANQHVNVAAAEAVVTMNADTAVLHQWARNAKNWRAQATLYSKLKNVDNEVKGIYAGSNNDYQKAALLNAVSDVNFIFDQYKINEAKVIKSTAASRLADLSSDLTIYKQIIADGDQGSLIPVCFALRDTTRGFKKTVTDYSFLEAAKNKLSLPRDYETYVPLERTLNYFKGLPPPAPLKNEYNHPIDWTLAATIAKNQRVLIQTSKGDIQMQLFLDEAPGSVVNFVKLVNDKYFDGKFFHRVVPNFVIQTGCNRGDGFGSEDYSIRSEFSERRYKTGSVGMASAGKDTEGTQWFITHSPTPHLDGKYTIFAEVVAGMDVVHKIEVGDKIISARLIE